MNLDLLLDCELGYRRMTKLPAILFYTRDWLGDPELSKCMPSTRGIWMDALCAMHESDRCGTLSGTTDQLARVCRCNLTDMHAAIADLKTTGAADVRELNGIVTLVNRRMHSDYLKRLATKKRVEKHRCNTKPQPPPVEDEDVIETPGKKGDAGEGNHRDPDRWSAANSFARNWLTVEHADYLKPKYIAPFARLIYDIGKEKAVARALRAIDMKHVENPFLYAMSMNDEPRNGSGGRPAAARPRQRSAVAVREDN